MRDVARLGQVAVRLWRSESDRDTAAAALVVMVAAGLVWWRWPRKQL